MESPPHYKWEHNNAYHVTNICKNQMTMDAFFLFGYRSHLDPHDDDSDDSSTDSDSPKIATPLDKYVCNIHHHINMYAPSKYL